MLSSACAPVVQHGPWVEPGLSGSAGASAFMILAPGEGIQPWGSIDAGIRLGIGNEVTHEGVSLGLQVPIVAALYAYDTDDESVIPSLINIDGYIALPKIQDLNPSIGITTNGVYTMPYLQIGKYDKWYTTHSLAFINDEFEDVWFYSPSFTTVHVNGPKSRTLLTFSAGLGKGDDDFILTGGLSIIFEFTRARN
jgi:hypothetical protein